MKKMTVLRERNKEKERGNERNPRDGSINSFIASTRKERLSSCTSPPVFR